MNGKGIKAGKTRFHSFAVHSLACFDPDCGCRRYSFRLGDVAANLRSALRVRLLRHHSGSRPGEPLPAILRRPPADPLGEGIREDEWILIADFGRDGFAGLLGRGQQFRRALPSEICDLGHRAAAQLPPAQAAQVFMAIAGFARAPGQRPRIRQICRHPLPQHLVFSIDQGLGRRESLRPRTPRSHTASNLCTAAAQMFVFANKIAKA